MSSVWVCIDPSAEPVMAQLVKTAHGYLMSEVVGACAYMLGNAVADATENLPPSEQGHEINELLRHLQSIMARTVVLRLGDGIKGH